MAEAAPIGTSSDKEEEPPPPKTEENLIVALRTRPINNDEIRDGATPIAHKVDDNMVILLDPTEDPDDILRANRSREKQYVFDKSFDGSCTQHEVYENTTKFLIPSVINGYNATVFAYGATGAGKTYTMLGTDDEPGIMARTLNDLFHEMDKSKSENVYKVSLSYLEIYNEMIRDLLNPTTGYLDLREDAKGTVGVAGLSTTTARSASEIMALLKRGNLERTQEPTAANKTSSRSHAVLQITVRQRTRVRDIRVAQRVGKLFLIDLAGSERAANTHNRGKRMVEGAHINRSLLALGNCINALSDKNSSKYVNYRDSKLTRLLKDALGGNCKTVMIAHISPASIHFEESRNTLVYADRAKNIKTKVRRNVMDVTYHIAQYTNIIVELRDEIKRLKSKISGQDSNMVSRNSSAIHAIQNEVLAAGRREDQEEINKFKEELLKGFRNQMDFRRNLMEINQTTMEIEFERRKQQMVIERWEAEKEARHGLDNKYVEEEKEDEPQQVTDAKSELTSLDEERDRTDRIKSRLQKELDNAKNKAAKVEEALPNKINSTEQQEVLGLLCKVHELEIDNMQMQSACLLRDAQIKQQNLTIERYRHHRSLTDEIIRQQRFLLIDNKVQIPNELEHLYRLYQQQVKDRANSPTDRRVSLPDINLYKNGMTGPTLSRKLLDAEQSDTERLSAVDEESTGDPAPKLFTTSGKQANKVRKQLLARSVANMTKNDLAESMTRQKSIITLSSRSNSSSPSVPNDAVPRIEAPVQSPVKDMDRRVISNRTRSIAALAHQRRSKAHVDALNTERTMLTAADDTASQSGGYNLTQSRLAQHDSKYGGSSMTLRQAALNDDLFSNPGTDTHSVGTADNTQRAKNRALYRNGQPPKKQPSTTTTRRKPRPEYGASYQKLAKTSPRKNHLSDAHSSSTSLGNVTRRGARIPLKSTRPKLLVPSTEVDFDEDFDRFTPPPVQTVRQVAPEKGRGQTVQKKVKVAGHTNGAADHSSSSTPQNKKPYKPPPTIPNYGKEAEISVSGFGLGQR